jgi:hypothetical protein
MLIPGHRDTTERIRDDRVFVLRFWIERESTLNAVPFWRARVSDLASGQEKHLNGVEAALNHVRELMAADPS